MTFWLLFFCSFANFSWSTSSFPPVPQNAIHDETASLPGPSVATQSDLLLKHRRTTDDQILIGVFQSHGKESVTVFARRLFRHWQPGLVNKQNGALILFFVKEKETLIYPGFGLESILTEEITTSLTKNIALPVWKSRGLAPAVHALVLGVLQALGSPILNGETAAAPNDEMPSGTNPSLAFWLGLFFILMAGGYFFSQRLAAEVHFSSAGTEKITRMKKLLRPKPRIALSEGVYGRW